MKGIILFVILTFLSLELTFSQDWQCFRDSVITNYIYTEDEIRSVHFSSVYSINGYRYYENFNSMNQVGPGPIPT
ncbi:MAG: hypothetical protein HXX13_12575 [Bacteroidetes bacterium]|nr:hypothetical protein [Bacteroidota bacterium]